MPPSKLMSGETQKPMETANAAPELTASKAVSLLWNSAWEALLLAFLIQILGGVALAMMGNVWGRMMPSLPPTLTSDPKLESSVPAHPTFHFGARERFILIFAVVFAGMAFGRLLKHSRNANHRTAADLTGRLMKRVSEEWFQVVVVNAFVASIMVSVFQVTNQYTPLKILWRFMADALRVPINAFVDVLPQGPAGVAAGLLAWYGANQLKFSFWVLYGAAICDDLGLPNYKALARCGWRRIRRKRYSLKPAGPVDKLGGSGQSEKV